MWLAEMLAVLVLLSAGFLLALSSMLQKSPTFDEVAYLAGGTSYWRYNDYRMNSEGGMLSQRWAALPLALDPRVEFPQFDPQDSPFTQWTVARRFFYASGNHPDSMFLTGRVMMLVIGLVLGGLVYCWSRRLFNRRGALLSLSLFALSPTMLAHSRLVTSDVPVACAFLAATWAVWHMMQKLTPGRVALAAFCLFLLFIAKMSAFFMIPIFFLMLVARLFSRQPLKVVWPGNSLDLTRKGAVLASLLASGVLCAMVIFAGVWASFGMRYSMLHDQPAGNALMQRQWDVLQAPGLVCRAVNVAREHRVLPEGFLYGFLYTFKSSESRLAFCNGAYRTTGWLLFFPYCFLVKTPIPTLCLMLGALCLGAGALLRLLRGWADPALRERAYAVVPLLALIGVYLLFAVTSKLNIGHRHLLVIYPPLFILTGALGPFLARKRSWLAGLVVLCVALLMFESLRIWPDYLAYFNAFAGGPKNAYRHLVDSSLDWGQDLPGLKRWMQKNNYTQNVLEQDLYVSFFGSVALEEFGIQAKKLPCFFPQPQNMLFELKGGVYCISATMLQLNPPFPGQIHGQWTAGNESQFQANRRELEGLFRPGLDSPQAEKQIREKGAPYWLNLYRNYERLRFAKLCRFLRTREPDEQVGYSILIYKLSEEDLQNALGFSSAVPGEPGQMP
jgi:4-amino-4-deoxy-L-arabinose transferase-like glycosyltransferase